MSDFRQTRFRGDLVPLEVNANTVHATIAQMTRMSRSDVGTILRNCARVSTDGSDFLPDRIKAGKMIPKCLKVLANREAIELKIERTGLNRRLRELGSK
jgi:hypothetical protein